MRTLRKLVLGETWALPVGIGLAVALAAVVRVAAGAGGWWRETGGWLLFVALAVALVVAVCRPRRPEPGD